MFNTIYEDLNERNWFYSRQHGFRKFEGSEEALILLIKIWKEIINNGIDENGKNIKCTIL